MYEKELEFQKKLVDALKRLYEQFPIRGLKSRMDGVRLCAPEVLNSTQIPALGKYLVEEAEAGLFEAAMKQFETFAPAWVNNLRASRS